MPHQQHARALPPQGQIAPTRSSRWGAPSPTASTAAHSYRPQPQTQPQGQGSHARAARAPFTRAPLPPQGQIAPLSHGGVSYHHGDARKRGRDEFSVAGGGGSGSGRHRSSEVPVRYDGSASRRAYGEQPEAVPSRFPPSVQPAAAREPQAKRARRDGACAGAAGWSASPREEGEI